MFTKTTTLLFAAMQASLAIAGNAVLSNSCSYDIWVWSVDQTSSSAAIRVPARTKYTEPLRSACEGCGTSLKVSKTNQLTGGAQTQFEYSMVNNQIWYDMSLIDCAEGQNADSCPGHDEGLSMAGSDNVCGNAVCTGGKYCPTQSYYVDFPMAKLGMQDPVFTCPGKGTNVDIVMTVCSDASSSKRSIAGRIMVDVE